MPCSSENEDALGDTRISPSRGVAVEDHAVEDTAISLDADGRPKVPARLSPLLFPPETKQRVGPFEIKGILGSGGMGVVYRAVAPDGTPAAVKVLSAALAAKPLDRFEREAAVRIDHPNIVKVLAADTRAIPLPYIAFELLEGRSLEARVAEGVLPPAETLRIGVQICCALEAAHEAGVIHRDLKPANVFLCDDGSVKVLDFGIALVTDESRLTITGGVMGTPAYLAPEQARGESGFDARTDVWGAGAVLYHALTGRPPFLRSTSLAAIVAVLMERHAPLWTVAPEVPASLAAVIERA